MQPTESSSWDSSLARLRAAHTELMRRTPYRDLGLAPFPAAAAEAIQDLETRLGRPLPPSYRAFLRRHDGWPRFFDGASLLGTKDLGSPGHLRQARAILRAAASPSASTPPSYRTGSDQVLVFGIDRAQTTVFAFDLDPHKLTREPPVIAWVSELGLRYPTFSDFLSGLSALAEAELAELRATDEAYAEMAQVPARRTHVADTALRRSA